MMRRGALAHIATLAMLAAGAMAGAACTGVRAPTPPPDEPVRLVLTEPWADGGRLVIVGEDGDRRAPLLAEPGADEHPTFVFDGRWVVFASARGRTDGKTSLWAAPAVPEAVPVRLTDGPWRDLDPAWDAGGPAPAIVFASDRGGGDLDLYRLPLALDDAGMRAAGPPVALTDSPAHELAPTVAAGRTVVQVVEDEPARSYLAERTADGALIGLTAGPSDGAPALSPDGRRLAYVVARVRSDGRRDLDVVVEALDPGPAAAPPSGVGLEATDEGAPVWSVDGRWLFATSIVRDADGAPMLSSVVHLDTWERTPRVRMLRDRVGAIPRLGAALAPAILDAAELGRNPDYLPALAQAVAELQARRAEEAQARRSRARRAEPL